MIIIPDEQLSLALGKSGYNVKLASQLTGYYFDIKTETDIKENPELLKDIVPLNQIFSDTAEETEAPSEETDVAEVFESNLYSLQGIDEAVIKALIDNGINSIEELYNLSSEDIMAKTNPFVMPFAPPLLASYRLLGVLPIEPLYWLHN